MCNNVVLQFLNDIEKDPSYSLWSPSTTEVSGKLAINYIIPLTAAVPETSIPWLIATDQEECFHYREWVWFGCGLTSPHFTR